MKKIRTFLIVMLMGAMVLSLSACNKSNGGGGSSEAETLLKTAQENMQNAKSMTYEIIQDMEMTIMGIEVPVKMNMDVEFIAEPLLAKLTGQMDSGGMGTFDMEMYLEGSGDKTVVYTGMNFGEGELYWTKQTVDVNASAATQYNAGASLDIYMDAVKEFKEAGTEEVNGVSTTKYEGIITGDAIAKVIESAGMEDQIGVDIEEIAEYFKDSGDLTITFWVDPVEARLIKYETDMSEVLSVVMEKVIEAEGGTEMEGITVGISKAITTVTITGVDNVSEVVIPDEVKEAEELELAA